MSYVYHLLGGTLEEVNKYFEKPVDGWEVVQAYGVLQNSGMVRHYLLFRKDKIENTPPEGTGIEI